MGKLPWHLPLHRINPTKREYSPSAAFTLNTESVTQYTQSQTVPKWYQGLVNLVSGKGLAQP